MSGAGRIPDGAFLSHAAILGKTGSGKTYTAKGLVEGFLDKDRRVCILDPTGVWYGLRTTAAGRAGYPITIFGGDHADIPIDAHCGAEAANLVAKDGVNAIIDTLGMSVTARTEFARDFLAEAFRVNRSPIHLVIDEAHLFMPQSSQGATGGVARNEMINAANTLVSGGRARGWRILLISQRPAKVHKDSLTQCDGLIAHRVVHPLDRNAVKAWIDGCGDPETGAKVLASLAKLDTGEAWAWFPEHDYLERRKFPRIKTADTSGQPDAHATPVRTVAQVDIAAVTKAMLRAKETADANDPAKLRARIAELERGAARSTAPKPPDPAALRQAEERGRAEEHARLGAIAQMVSKSIRAATAELAKIEADLNGLATPGPDKARNAGLPPGFVELPRRPGRTAELMPRDPEPAGNPPRTLHITWDPPGLRGGERKVLEALIQHPDGLSRAQLTVLTGYKRSSRDTYIQRLAARGYAGTDAIRVFATDAGRQAMPDARALPTGTELQEYWLARLGAGEAKILRALLDAYPDLVTKEQLSEQTGYKRSSRDTYLQRLAARSLIEPRMGEVRAAPTLFGDRI